jgi:hypothetical protein
VSPFLSAAAAVAWSVALVAGYVRARPPGVLRLFPQGTDPWRLDVFAPAVGGHLLALVGVLAWVLALAAWGRPALAWLSAGAARRGHPLARHLALGAGFGLLGLAALAAGWTGLLAPGPLALIVLGPAVLGGWRASRDLARAAADFLTGWRTTPGDWVLRAAVALPILAALPSMFSPEVSWDAMVYHLRLPTFWLMEHRHFAQPDSPFTGYPCLTEIHYALVMAFARSDRPAKLMHAACWLMAARALFLYALPFGRRPAFGAALLWLGSPLGILLAGAAYVDLATAWLVTLAAIAALAAPFLAGVLCGVAFLTKFTGGFAFVGLLACVASRKPRRLVHAVAGFSVPAAAWLARDWFALGNPVYPFATGLLGGVSSATVDYWRAHPPAPGSGDLPGPLHRLMLALTTEDAGVGAPPGGLWLAALGPAMLAGLADRRWRFIAAAGVLWLALPLDGRFLFPLLPAAILAAAPAWRAPWFRWTTAGTVAVLVPLGAWDALRTATLQFDPLPPALGLRGFARHMRSGLPPQPEYWEGAMMVNARLPKSARLLFVSGIKSYRFDRRCTVPHQHLDPCPLLREWTLAQSPRRLAIRLREEGFSHVIYFPRVAGVLADLPYVSFAAPDAAGIVAWLRGYTRFDFRWGEMLAYALTRNARPRALGRVPVVEEYAMKEAMSPGDVRAPWVVKALEKLAPESSTLGQAHGIRTLMGPPPRPVEALVALGQATRSEEASPATWRAYAFALGETGEGMRALACYRQALELLPTDGQAHFGAGIILARAGRLREAVEEFAAAIRIEPGRAEFRQAFDQVSAAIR